MSDACDHCAKPVKSDDEHITCMAFCERMIHLRCSATKLNKPFVKIVHDSPNLFWMCDECAKLMKIARFKSVVSSFGDAFKAIADRQEMVHAEIRKELAIQGQQIAQLSKRMAPTSPFLRESASSSRQPPSKRRRDDELVFNPAVTKPLLGGTKEMSNAGIVTVPEPVQLFWVYLSRIHPSVKPEAIEKLVKDCLQSEGTVKAVPLVKRGIDSTRLSFISYKIGIDPKLRDAALSPDTWPKGLLFREFEDNSSKNLWLPSLNTPTIMVSPEVGASQFSTPTTGMDLSS